MIFQVFPYCEDDQQRILLFTYLHYFLAPTGALEERMLYVRASVCDIIQKKSEYEF